MSVSRAVPGRRRTFGALAGLTVALFLFAGAFPPAAGAAGGAHGALLDPCSGPTAPDSYTGQVSVLGGSLPASWVEGVPLQYQAEEQEVVTNVTTGVIVNETCGTANGTAETNASGAFAFGVTLPAPQCTPSGQYVLCRTWSGPYGTVTVTAGTPAPPGYELAIEQNGTRFAVEYAALLATVVLGSGTGAATLAPNESITVAARPLTALGTPSPCLVYFEWNLSAPGWSITFPSGNGSSAVLRAGGTAGSGALSVNVTTSTALVYHFSATTSEALQVAITRIAATGANGTSVDVGDRLLETANASGAPGLPYTATFQAGPGDPVVSVPCTEAAETDLGVVVDCAAAVPFAKEGATTPIVAVTNGFSSAEDALPPVNVTPPPDVSLAPSSLVGYSGAPLRVTVEALPGGGTPPYRSACVAADNAVPSCSPAPGPNWTFTPVFAVAGNSSVRGWVVDADGTNRSASAPVRIVPPLLVTATPGLLSGVAGTPVTLSAQVMGGDLPAAYWWNGSGPTPVLRHGSLTGDGPLSVTIVPASPGGFRYTLTVVDLLRSPVSAAVVLSAAPAPASSIEPVAPGSGASVVVGVGAPMDWQAVDRAGQAVPAFAAPADLWLNTPSGRPFPGWVNASGIGGLTAGRTGAFAVPPDAWVNGSLRLTVTAGTAGTFDAVLTGATLPGPPPVIVVVAEPDRDHLKLAGPVESRTGGPTNDTLWRVEDRFGDAAIGASVIVELASAVGETVRIETASAAAEGAATIWVNFTAGPIATTVRVLDLAGDVLLGPLLLSPPGSGPAPYPALLWLGLSVPIGAAAAGLTARRRARVDRAAPLPLEEELERLAEARARIVGIVSALGGADRAGIEAVWEPPPAPAELDEWIASLATDGTLRWEDGPGERGRWVVSTTGPPVVRVTLDSDALDRAIARREEEAGEEPPAEGE